MTGRRVGREALAVLLVGAAAGGAVWLLFLLASYRARADLLVVAGLAVAVTWRLVRLTVPPAQVTVPPPRREAPDDGLLVLTSLEHRLSWGSVDADRFRERVRPVLVDLAQERLRSRHGVDPATQPDQARRILGESLWQLMTGPPPGRSPSRPELSRLVDELERI